MGLLFSAWLILSATPKLLGPVGSPTDACVSGCRLISHQRSSCHSGGHFHPFRYRPWLERRETGKSEALWGEVMPLPPSLSMSWDFSSLFLIGLPPSSKNIWSGTLQLKGFRTTVLLTWCFLKLFETYFLNRGEKSSMYILEGIWKGLRMQGWEKYTYFRWNIFYILVLSEKEGTTITSENEPPFILLYRLVLKICPFL